MKLNCSIDCSLTLGRYVFEASFWLRDWKILAQSHSCSAIKVLQIGPLCFCVTDLKKLKDAYDSKPQPISLDDLVDM